MRICAEQRSNTANARTDPLPDEKGGYAGFKALFGAKYVNPAITGGSESVDGPKGPRSSIHSVSPVSPASTGCTPRHPGEVAQMQEAASR